MLGNFHVVVVVLFTKPIAVFFFYVIVAVNVVGS